MTWVLAARETFVLVKRLTALHTIFRGGSSIKSDITASTNISGLVISGVTTQCTTNGLVE